MDSVLFLFLGTNMQLNNCFWMIRVALQSAGFGTTCAGESTDLG